MTFNPDQHPRIGNGTFTDKKHATPELSLGEATIAVPLTVRWTELGVIPPRSRTPRDIRRDLDVTVEVPSATSDDAPAGFTVTRTTFHTHDGRTEERQVTDTVRVHDGKLWRQMTERVGVEMLPMPATPDNIRSHVFPGGWDGKPHMDAHSAVAAEVEAQQDADGYLAVDGTLWAEAAEPVYYVRTFGMGGNHGGTSLFVGNAAEHRDGAHALPEWVFPADQRQEAIDYATKTATDRGDTDSLRNIAGGESIEVTGVFEPATTFNPAPRLTYRTPFEAQYEGPSAGVPGEVEKAFTEFKQQLLTVPGAVADVPDGWGGMTKKVDLTKLTSIQAHDYRRFLEVTGG